MLNILRASLALNNTGVVVLIGAMPTSELP